MPGPSVTWVSTEWGLEPQLADGTPVAWAYQPGFQEEFLSLPSVDQGGPFEVLLAGNRGGGKSSVILVDFAQHTGKGYGRRWRGIMFRRRHPDLQSLIEESHEIFGRAFPQATYRDDKQTWRWPDGESLKFAQMYDERDYEKVHGQNFARVMWDDLTLWPHPGPYLRMFSTVRSGIKGMPIGVRASSNPHGPGHAWVKQRFELPEGYGRTISYSLGPNGKREPRRTSIQAMLKDNRVLNVANPDYSSTVAASADSEAQRKAWEEGDWNIVAGGMFDDVWSPAFQVVPSIPFNGIPRGWKLDRSYDDGSSKPFSVGWWLESNGEPIEVGGRVIGPVRGDLIRLSEWYGWNGKPNEGLRMGAGEIAVGIRDRQNEWGIAGIVKPGPADTAIYNASPIDPTKSVASEMAKHGIQWNRAHKGSGSRVQGWRLIRELLRNAVPGPDGRREKPGLFVCERCDQFIRTVPIASRNKPPKDPDDIDTEIEDHILDETRYRVRDGSRDWNTTPGGLIGARYSR